MLIVKPNGVYFEGSIQDNEQFRGFFRNPVLKRQSRLDKDPDCSKRICYGVNEEGYVFLNNGQRYKGMLADSRAVLLDKPGIIKLENGAKVRGHLEGIDNLESQIKFKPS